MNPLEWNQEKAGRLETLHRTGLSFSQIAADIGTTRSAAIGKARRMKLARREIRNISTPGKRIAQPKPAAPPPAPEPPPKPAFKAEPGRDYSCTIYDLVDASCRFPLWELGTPHEQRKYCGVPAATFSLGNPYCPHHMLKSGTAPK